MFNLFPFFFILEISKLVNKWVKIKNKKTSFSAKKGRKFSFKA